MMTKSGLYEPCPVYYVQQLKRAGRRDMAMAFMDYWEDYTSSKKGFGEVKADRYYAKAWHNSYVSRGKDTIGISPDTAGKWIAKFKEVIGLFEAAHEMYEKAHRDLMDESVQKTIGQQSDNNRTTKSSSNAEKSASSKEQSQTNRKSIGQKEKRKKNIVNERRFNDDDIRLSELLFGYLQRLFPKIKKPNIQTWADSCRLMRESDGRKVEEIENMIRYIFSDEKPFDLYDGSFWQSNVMSMAKLRAKYDQIAIQIRVKAKRVA